MLNVHTDERAWRIGADGEEAVGDQLEKMARKNPRWHVLHAVPVGERGSDIDHLVIGPAGIFTINAKHHPGAKIWVGKDQLRVNGHVEPYIRNSRFEAKRASRILSAAVGFEVVVDALVILFGVEDITIKTQPGEKDGSTVHVKYRRQAVRWLGQQATRLSDDQVEAIYEQSRRSTTWVAPS
ncbi:NERD domain-containing protein [Nocardioides eburneiflavus]|uniref:NERD domain-containing protein n=1 Tax=Nocardioides eburneiflavus TaxID=2518372 RepID=A0A4Z1CNU7_9ACTN|nr:NERD domain-containing protein [Nocardioides eburneiflavus]